MSDCLFALDVISDAMDEQLLVSSSLLTTLSFFVTGPDDLQFSTWLNVEDASEVGAEEYSFLDNVDELLRDSKDTSLEDSDNAKKLLNFHLLFLGQ